MLREVQDEQADASRHGSLASHPVAQHADDLVVVEERAIDRGRQQGTRHVVGGGGTMLLQVGLHMLGEQLRQRPPRRGIPPEGRQLVAVRPAAEALPLLFPPAEEGAQRAQREGRRERLHQLRPAVAEDRFDQLDRDLTAAMLERRHDLLREVGRQRRSEACVRRWIDPARNRRMPRRAAEGGWIREHPHHVLVAEQRPTHELAMGHGTGLAHPVVGLTLVHEHSWIPWIPIITACIAQSHSSLWVRGRALVRGPLVRGGRPRPGRAGR